MAGFINELFGNTTNASADATIAMNAMSSSAAAATAYLNASLASTTPEVRRLLSEYSAQSAMANGTLTELAINRKWVNPYDSPQNQLQNSMSQAQSVTGGNNQ